MFKMVSALMVMVLLPGCAALSGKGGAGDEVAAKTAIQSAAMKYIDNDQERANRMIEVVSKAEGLMESEKVTTVDALEQKIVEDVIDWQQMEPSEKLVVKRVIESVKLRIEQEIEDKNLDPGTKVAVRNVLAWLREAAELSGATADA